MNNYDHVPPEIDDLDKVSMGDMPGDRINITPNHVAKAKRIMREIARREDFSRPKTVLSVFGGSGVGKSEIGALLRYYLRDFGIPAYLLSGDNYPRRIPSVNDGERLRRYRESGLKALVRSREYSEAVHGILRRLQEEGRDPDPALIADFPWLATYQAGGTEALELYLGTEKEIDFEELNGVISAFKGGAREIMLKRMGRSENEQWYDCVSFDGIRSLVIEWTHGNNPRLRGVDFAVLLNSLPEETLEHRRSRNRDNGVDTPFMRVILGIEQEQIRRSAERAGLIVTKSGDVIDHNEYAALMDNAQKRGMHA
jgi:hypothetical protein